MRNTVWGLVLFGLMFAAFPAWGEENGKFLTVGAASADITPDRPVMLGGYASRTAPHEGVRSPIFTYALYAKSGDEVFLWTESDLVGIESEDALVIRQKISEATGVPVDRVIVSATHTHSAPVVSEAISSPPETDYLENYFEPRLIDAAKRAVETAELCTMTVVQGESFLAHDRRNDPVPGDGAAPNADKSKACVDTRVPAVAFKRADGSFKAVLIQYAMHPTSWGDQNIGSEWPGATAIAVRKEFGEDVEPFVLQGAAGNVGSPCRKAPPEVLQSWGDDLVASVTEKLRNEQPLEKAQMAADSGFVPVEYDLFTEDEIHAKAQQFRSDFAARPDWIEYTVDPWERNSLAVVQSGQTAESAFIQTVALGEHVFVTTPFETFAHLNKYLCEKVPYPVHVIGYTNGETNYLPSIDAYAQGGYEAGSYIWFHRLPMKPGALEKLADDLVPMLNRTAERIQK